MQNGSYAIYKGQTYRYASLKGGKMIKLLSDVHVDGFEQSDAIFRLIVSRSECERTWKQELYFWHMGDRSAALRRTCKR